MSPDFIFTMKDLRKVVPPKREILKGIWLSFFPGAKIGVLGLNGAGKSSLLRIMAGIDTDFIGEATPRQGLHRRHSWPRSRSSTRPRPCSSNVEEGVGGTRPCCDRFERGQRALRRADGRRRDGEAARGAGEAPGQDRRRQRAGSSTATLEIAMDALRCPPRRRGRGHAVGRRAPPRGAVPAAAGEARPAAARRAHQPPRRRVGGLARALPEGVPRHGRGRDPRPLLPRQRGRVDPRARPRRGHPLEGQLLVAGSSRSTSA